MKIIKCPSCGYVMKDGETRYACPKCGCSADSFISIGDSEATSRNSAPSAWQQNKGTSDNISNQPTKGNKVICPDCGKIFDEEPIPSSCPNCGCPSSAYVAKEIADANEDTNFSSEEKIYYRDNSVKITNKLWSFGGYNVVDDNIKSISFYPVSAISCVVVSRNMIWWILLLLGLLGLGYSVLLFTSMHGDVEEFNLTVGIVFIAISILLFYFAHKLYNQRVLHVKPHNSMASYTLTVKTPQEAQKYLNPMLKCLIENN